MQYKVPSNYRRRLTYPERQLLSLCYDMPAPVALSARLAAGRLDHQCSQIHGPLMVWEIVTQNWADMAFKPHFQQSMQRWLGQKFTLDRYPSS